MRPLSLLFSAALLLAGTPAFAQWMWLDKDGRKVFSDRAPPPEVPAKSILKQPGMPARSASDAAGASDGAAGARSDAPDAAKAAPGKSGLDKAVEERKRQAEAADNEKKKAEEARIASQKADNCARARQNMATLQSGIRLAQVNENGERVILDDSARNAELGRAQATIDSDCR
ncbi:MAG: DUF4124 domain-containing protein [Curvibacter lanceolatus]|uniref:DUF4124 domain-containing protein n=1 Tax=Curvibacter lanceolatus TaxID=86182 RepID=UPI0003A28F81|nr:DUF4124 domain-containing protein [Curvibacter lanceolatus]MBV5292316.1 DUF4124 domain-containing protein [Curvibacter lanceolatus]